FQNEPVLSSGDNRQPDAIIEHRLPNPPGGDIVLLRSERQVPPDGHHGRLYKIFFRATDPFGEFCTGYVMVCVRNSNDPTSDCVDQGTVYDSTQCPVLGGSCGP